MRGGRLLTAAAAAVLWHTAACCCICLAPPASFGGSPKLSTSGSMSRREGFVSWYGGEVKLVLGMEEEGAQTSDGGLMSRSACSGR